jgi:hypothetical protein
MKKTITALAAAALALASVATFAADTAPNGKGGSTYEARMVSGKSVAATGSILYHGGPVMTNAAGVNVYVIWYGNWSGNTATTIVPEFLSHLGGTPHWNINTTYYDASNTHVKNLVSLAGQTTDSYSQGTRLTDKTVRKVVASAINSGRLPKDTNGLYFVLSSKDVSESSGFCSQYCGWHNHGTIATADIKYSFVGDAARCITSCAAQSTGPNGNAGADGMLSVITHELEETVTDPDLNAWSFSNGQENGDACAWTFGTEYTTANGAKANMNINGHDYLIQQNWIAPSTGCAVGL